MHELLVRVRAAGVELEFIVAYAILDRGGTFCAFRTGGVVGHIKLS